MTVPRVIGLDLSLTSTGIASNAAWTTALKPPAALRGHQRLARLLGSIREHVTDAHLVVVEGPAYGSQRAGLQRGVHERAGLWWMVTHSLWQAEIPFAVADPTAVKKYATGKGNADKAGVMLAAARRFPWFTGGEDEADAAWMAALGADFLGCPMATVPAVNRSAVDKVTWPDLVAVPA